MRGAGQPVVGLELDHGPHRHAHRRERFLERVKLREQRGLHALGRLVPGPQAVAERLDHMIGGDADMRGALLDHLQHRVQHAVHGAERRVLALVEAPLAVEVPEQLVRAVDEVNDQIYAGRSASSSGTISSTERTPQSCIARTSSVERISSARRAPGLAARHRAEERRAAGEHRLRAERARLEDVDAAAHAAVEQHGELVSHRPEDIR